MISVVIPAHNPDAARLAKTLQGLRAQTLAPSDWETVIIDNASTPPVDMARFKSVGPANLRIIREEQLGLTPARLRGFAETTGEIVILVDDDNVLAPDYLATAKAIGADHPQLGAWSGNVVLEFEPGATPPPAGWRSTLTERHVTEASISTDREHHESTPWGAGLCIRREVCNLYADTLARDPLRRQLDLHGQTLLYGGDTDITYVGCEHGFAKGVFPKLTLQHLIPAHRCKPNYLLRSIEGHAYSSVLHQFILRRTAPPMYFSNPLRRLWHWLRRLSLPRELRLEQAARTRGYALGEIAARKLAKGP